MLPVPVGAGDGLSEVHEEKSGVAQETVVNPNYHVWLSERFVYDVYECAESYGDRGPFTSAQLRAHRDLQDCSHLFRGLETHLPIEDMVRYTKRSLAHSALCVRPGLALRNLRPGPVLNLTVWQSAALIFENWDVLNVPWENYLLLLSEYGTVLVLFSDTLRALRERCGELDKAEMVNRTKRGLLDDSTRLAAALKGAQRQLDVKTSDVTLLQRKVQQLSSKIDSYCALNKVLNLKLTASYKCQQKLQQDIVQLRRKTHKQHRLTLKEN